MVPCRVFRAAWRTAGMDRLLELTHRAEQTHFWFRGFRRFVAPVLARAAGGRTGLTLLDCGCGTGNNLKMLAPYGTAFGFDITFRGLEFARQYGLTRVAHASIGEIPFPDATFDIVTTFDVLYGLPDALEQAAVREVTRVLKPGGYALFTVAALESLRGGHGSLANELRRYTTTSIAQLMERHGLEVVHVAYTHFAIFPVVYAVRAWQRWRGGGQARPSETEISIPSAPVNALLTAALVVESWAQRVVNMPIGSSALCLARKRS